MMSVPECSSYWPPPASLAREGAALPPLFEPAYAQGLAELAVRFIERPHSAILIPTIIQDNLWRLLGAEGLPVREDKKIPRCQKAWAQDLFGFLKQRQGSSWTPRL